jgi:hypothetical protein
MISVKFNILYNFLNITDAKVNVETKEKIPSHMLTQLRQNINRLFHSNKSKESFSLQKSQRDFGPKSNLDVLGESHTKGFLTESKKLNFKSWISLPHIVVHLNLHNILYHS